jgi:hypothetical protein
VLGAFRREAVAASKSELESQQNIFENNPVIVLLHWGQVINVATFLDKESKRFSNKDSI